MLRDELHQLNKEKKEEIAKEEEKRQLKLERKKQTAFYQFQQRRKEKKEKKRQERYDEETKRFIQGIPAFLKKEAKKGVGYTDLYLYNHELLITTYKDCGIARYYLDRRGKEIIKYLQNEDIRYELREANHAIESYYSIRVLFEKGYGSSW